MDHAKRKYGDRPQTLNPTYTTSNFNASHKLQQSVASLISSQYVDAAESKELRDAFLAIDENRDGKHSREEIQAAYAKVNGQLISKDEVEELFLRADTDNSGFIDYDEFLAATMKKSKSMCEKNVLKAFKYFDENGDGVISQSEIATALGATLAEDEVWQRIIKQADTNGDGYIDIYEWQAMMEAV